MHKIIQFSARYAIFIVIVLAAITAAAWTQLGKLVIDVSPEALMVKNHPDRHFYQQVLEHFGTDNVSIIVIRDENLQHPETLTRIQMAIEHLDNYAFIERTESLFSVQHLRVEDEYVLKDPYLKEIPDTPEAVRALFADAQKNPFVRGNLLSSDGKTMAINVYLDERSRYPNYDRDVARALELALLPLQGEVDQVFQIGLPYVRDTIANDIWRDQQKLLPLSFVVLFITLILLVRSLNGGLIPLLTSLMSIVWILGFMAAMNIPLTLVTSIVPVLLIIIGSTEDVHLISEYMLAKSSGGDRLEEFGITDKKTAIFLMGKRKGFAILITFITSYMGFISISVNRIEMLQEFGIVASTGLLLNFIITILFVPAWIKLTDWRKSAQGANNAPHRFSWLLNIICYIVHQRQWTILFLFGSIALVSLYGATKIQLNNNVMGYFDESSPIRQRADAVRESLAGMESFLIVMDSGIEGTFLKGRYIEQITAIQYFAETSGLFDKTTSFADYLSVMNSVVNETGDISLPDDDLMINELQMFIRHGDVRNYISEDYSTAVIVVRHGLASSHELKDALWKLRHFVINNVDRGIQVHFTGESILTAVAADEMASGQAKSLIIMLAMIFIIISFLFFNIKAGLLAIIPNLFPIVVLFGVMGFMAIPLDTGTAMIAAIAIGIVIDDTMHFMVRYNRELKNANEESNAIANTMRAEAIPVISTSIALSMGFAVLSLSSFVPVMYFGLLSALVMLLALLADFLITPILLSNTRLVTLWDMLSLQLRGQLLKQCRLFKGLKAWQIKKLILLSNIRHFKKGEMIMREGDPATEMYVLLDGAVDVCITDMDGKRKVVDSAIIGRLLGVFQTVGDDNRRHASAVATKDCTVLVITWSGIERIARFYPRITSRFFRNLSSLLGIGLVEQLKGKALTDKQPSENTGPEKTSTD